MLGVIVLAAIGFIFGKRYQKSLTTKVRTMTRIDVPYTQYYERVELPGPQHKQPTVQHSLRVEMPVNHNLFAFSELPGS